jgi:tetratricopeptide (TPR) repeat protein
MNNLGTALNAQGKYEEAIHQFRRALEISPEYYAAHNNLGITLNIQGKYTEAVQHFRQALRSKPDSPAPLSSIAWILVTHTDAKMRDPLQAIRLAERASELTQHRNPSILYVLAAAHAAAGNWDRARAIAETALAQASAANNAGLIARLREQLKLYTRNAKHHLAAAHATN